MALETQADFAGDAPLMDKRKAKLDATTRDRGQNFLAAGQLTALQSRAAAETFLKTTDAAYYTDGRLNYMTWNDLKFAIVSTPAATAPY